jgi:proteic killer suppression protein
MKNPALEKRGTFPLISLGFSGRAQIGREPSCQQSVDAVSAIGLHSPGHDQDVSEQGARRSVGNRRDKMHGRILRCLDYLEAATLGTEMNIPGYRFHSLRGKPLRYSVHINGPWCITFEFEGGGAIRVDFEQYH